jgi:hypothetical protein
VGESLQVHAGAAGENGALPSRLDVIDGRAGLGNESRGVELDRRVEVAYEMVPYLGESRRVGLRREDFQAVIDLIGVDT